MERNVFAAQLFQPLSVCDHFRQLRVQILRFGIWCPLPESARFRVRLWPSIRNHGRWRDEEMVDNSANVRWSNCKWRVEPVFFCTPESNQYIVSGMKQKKRGWTNRLRQFRLCLLGTEKSITCQIWEHCRQGNHFVTTDDSRRPSLTLNPHFRLIYISDRQVVRTQITRRLPDPLGWHTTISVGLSMAQLVKTVLILHEDWRISPFVYLKREQRVSG